MSRSPIWQEMTAVFGGTFDPPHLGHRMAMQGVLTVPGVAQVIALPSGLPPLKGTATHPSHRVEMAKLAFSDIAKVDDREILRSSRTGKPSYSYDTLQEYRREFRAAMTIGSDQLEGLEGWHRFPEILGLCSWIVLERKPQGREQAMKVLQKWETSGLVAPWQGEYFPTWKLKTTWLILVPTDAPDLSSTQIRESIAKTGAAPQGALSSEVLQYLKQNGLYGSQK